MKKTMFLSMLAATLLGGQAFAGTNWEGDLDKKSEQPERVYGMGSLLIKEDQSSGYAKLGEVAGKIEIYESVSGASVTMTGGSVGILSAGVSMNNSANDNVATISGGSVEKLYAGYSAFDYESPSANSNKAIMTGGSVGTLCAGCSEGKGGEATISGNVVLVTGGKASAIYGALNLEDSVGTSASGNKVYITGMDQGSAASVFAASGGTKSEMNNNQVHLVGAGAEVVVAGEKRTGSVFSVGDVVAVRGYDTAKASGNSINIYGSGISARSLSAMQQLNFHVAKEQLESGASPMITLTNAPLDLTGFLVPTEDNPSPALALTFDAMSSMLWAPGTSVTLVSAALGIKIDESLLDKEYKIYNSSSILEEAVATATLKLEQGEGSTQFLKLVVPGNIPEPASGTLGLLALAAQAARRKR